MIISTIRDLRPGDIGLGPIGGLAGIGVGLGQLALGEPWSIPAAEGDTERIKIRHACIVTRAAQPGPPSPTGYSHPAYVEAMPGGARQTQADRWTADWAWVRLAEDYPGQAEDAAAVAMQMALKDVPYSITSYRHLARWRLGLDTARTLAWINRRQDPISWFMPSGRMMDAGLPAEAICSVLVDQAWTLTGKKIMIGVPHQCVTPAGLAHRLRYETPSAVWAFPGRSR